MIGIYRIYDTTTDKSYIGKSVDIIRRWNEHIEQGAAATIYGDEFHYLLNSRPDTFTFEILKICKESELSELEEYYMIAFNSIKNGYNKIKAAKEVREDRIVARNEYDMRKRLNEIMGKPLFVEDKVKLCEFFGYRDNRGRLLGWKTLKRKLIENGLDIIETKRNWNGKPRNCSIISIKFNY